MNIESDIYLKQGEDTTSKILDGEAMILDLNTSELYSLNSTATVIWKACQDKATPEEIVDRVVEEFQVERSAAQQDCLAFIEDFLDQGLLQEDSQ